MWWVVLGAQVARVGHGVTLALRPELIQAAAESRTCVEICLTSNVCGMSANGMTLLLASYAASCFGQAFN